MVDALTPHPGAEAASRDEMGPSARTALPGKLLWASAIAGSVALGTLYAVTVPRFLPYDEPSHWLNVTHIAAHWSLPVVGQDGVTYEGQQGPLAYVFDALVYTGARQIMGPERAFLMVRASGLIWLGLCMFFSYRLVRRGADWPDPVSPVIGVAIAFLNPMVIACAASVQNDVPALALALMALDLAVGRTDHWTTGFVAGAVAGLALITKFTTFPVLIVIAGWFLWQRRYRSAVLALAAYMAVGAWWVIRNEHLYGDPTGAAAVAKLGIHWEPVGVHGVGTIVELIRAMVTFLWLPVEYYRNAIHAPPPLSLLVIAVTVAVLTTFVINARHRLRPGAAPVLLAGGLSIGLWMVVDVFVEGASFRLAYLALPAWAVATGFSTRQLGRKVTISVVGVLLLALHAWVLIAVANSTAAETFG